MTRVPHHRSKKFRTVLLECGQASLMTLATGFLSHPANLELRQQVVAPGGAAAFHVSLLRLVLRLLFLVGFQSRSIRDADNANYVHSLLKQLGDIADNHHGLTWENTKGDGIWPRMASLWHQFSGNFPTGGHFGQVENVSGNPAGRDCLFTGLGWGATGLETFGLPPRHLADALSCLIEFCCISSGSSVHSSSSSFRLSPLASRLEVLGAVEPSPTDIVFFYEDALGRHLFIDTSGDISGSPPDLKLVPGSARKTAGSYYTPPELIDELLRLTLDPVVAARLEKSRDLAPLVWEELPEAFRSWFVGSGSTTSADTFSRSTRQGSVADDCFTSQCGFPGNVSEAREVWQGLTLACRERLISEWGLLSLRVLDPACGTGNFLLAAARRLGEKLSCIRAGNKLPSSAHLQGAVRDVILHCLYGVDKDILAVELCRMFLWLEGFPPGFPPGHAFRDITGHIRCGDALVGILSPDCIWRGLPSTAFQPLASDDVRLATRLKKQNERELQSHLTGQEELPFTRDEIVTEKTSEPASADNPERIRLAYHLWTAAFFQRLDAKTFSFGQHITTRVVLEALNGIVSPVMAELAKTLAVRYQFFHWPLEFPETASSELPLANSATRQYGRPAGRPCSPLVSFDVVLGNPPWEQIQLEELEFFSSCAPDITASPTATVRKNRIAGLSTARPVLWQEYQDSRLALAALTRFFRGSGQYPLSARGDLNTYSLFTERIRHLLSPTGRAGFIVPTGIATDAANRFLLADLLSAGQLVCLHDFENRAAIFPAVHRSYRFSLLVLSGGSGSVSGKPPAGTVLSVCRPRFSFSATRTAHLHDPHRTFSLSPGEIALFNPNTRNLPVFRTRQDMELTRSVYARVPVLVNEQTGDNPWQTRFLAMFHLSQDSHLFRPFPVRGTDNGDIQNPVFSVPCVPLHEARMVWHYDHRYGTYEGVADRSATQLRRPKASQYADPNFTVRPWHWVPTSEVDARLGDWKAGWLLGFRDITSASNERTIVPAIVPRAGYGNNFLLVLPYVEATLVSLLLGCLASLSLDYIARQKIASTAVKCFAFKQLPILPPSAYSLAAIEFIVPRVLELTFTAGDIRPFADDVWKAASPQLRQSIASQWEENRDAVAGAVPGVASPVAAIHLSPFRSQFPDTPDTSDREGFPFSPFIWDEHRRMQLRAELDAFYARLYGLTRKQLRYVLDPADLTEMELRDICDPQEEVEDPLDASGYRARVAASTFPGETFRVLKRKEEKRYGEYLTRRLVLQAWMRLENR